MRLSAIVRIGVFLSLIQDSGSLRDRPTSIKLGWLQSLLAVIPFLYLGSVISREGAAYMEEYEIFVPSDDD